jgi:hypothetical protein
VSITGAALLIVALAVVLVAVLWWSSSNQRKATSSEAIVALLQQTGQPVQFWTSGPIWNPAWPEKQAWLFETGEATYTLDEAGIVHLEFHSKWGGAIQHFSGPIPKSDAEDSPAKVRQRGMMRLIWGSYLAILGVGFFVGYAVSSGSTEDRVGIGVVGLFAAMLVLPICTTLIRVAISARTAVRNKG